MKRWVPIAVVVAIAAGFAWWLTQRHTVRTELVLYGNVDLREVDPAQLRGRIGRRTFAATDRRWSARAPAPCRGSWRNAGPWAAVARRGERPSLRMTGNVLRTWEPGRSLLVRGADFRVDRGFHHAAVFHEADQIAGQGFSGLAGACL